MTPIELYESEQLLKKQCDREIEKLRNLWKIENVQKDMGKKILDEFYGITFVASDIDVSTMSPCYGGYVAVTYKGKGKDPETSKMRNCSQTVRLSFK